MLAEQAKVSYWLLIIYGILFMAVIGCEHLKRYSRAQRKHTADSVSKLILEGMTKEQVIQELGQPLAISESEVAESWYYARPVQVWIWFDQAGMVGRWELK